MNITHKEQNLTIPDNSIQSVGDLEVVGNGYADQSKTWNQVYAQNFATLDTRMEALSATSQAHSESFTALDSKVEALSISNQAHAENLSALDSELALLKLFPFSRIVSHSDPVLCPFRPRAVYLTSSHLLASINRGSHTFTLDSNAVVECGFPAEVSRIHVFAQTSSDVKPDVSPVMSMTDYYRRDSLQGRRHYFELIPINPVHFGRGVRLDFRYIRQKTFITIIGTSLHPFTPRYFEVSPHEGNDSYRYKVTIPGLMTGSVLLVP